MNLENTYLKENINDLICLKHFHLDWSFKAWCCKREEAKISLMLSRLYECYKLIYSTKTHNNILSDIKNLADAKFEELYGEKFPFSYEVLEAPDELK